MEIKKIIVGRTFEFVTVNTYLIIKNKKAVIVDPGDEADEIIKIIDQDNLIPQFIILTHGHIDHIKDTAKISAHYNIPVYIHEAEKVMLESSANNLSSMFGRPIQKFNIEKYLSDEEEIKFEGEKLKIIHTPGHTPGGICIKADNFLLSGDTLFENSIGRTDFPYGDEELLLKSIREKLFTLDDDIIVYPGHNNQTIIGKEKKNWGIT